MTFDAVLLASFGGPEGPDEVIPFLERVTAGRGVSRERLEAVAQHYLALGGVSPINAQNRRLIEALRRELERRGINQPIYWGNRNSAPFFADALRRSHADGRRRVLAVATSAYSSYSGCRQYRENLAAALAETAWPTRWRSSRFAPISTSRDLLPHSPRGVRCARHPREPRRRGRSDACALHNALHSRFHGPELRARGHSTRGTPRHL